MYALFRYSLAGKPESQRPCERYDNSSVSTGESSILLNKKSGKLVFVVFRVILDPRGGGTPYIRMIGMIVIFFRGCNQRFSIF